jgi:hypothetical protein
VAEAPNNRSSVPHSGGIAANMRVIMEGKENQLLWTLESPARMRFAEGVGIRGVTLAKVSGTLKFSFSFTTPPLSRSYWM